MQILASGKTGSQRYANNDLAKPVPALDMIELGQQTQRALEETQGYSLSNEEGSSASQNDDLSIIAAGDVSDYDSTLAKLIQTYVANNSYLDVDPSSTANNIILTPRKIADITSPDGTNYAKATSLPFNFRDNLKFVFRAAATNTDAVTISIPALAGLSGSIGLLDEQGSALTAGRIVANKYYTAITKTISTVKKLLLVEATLPSSSTSNAGSVQLATDLEALATSNTSHALTPSNLAAVLGMKFVTRLTASSSAALNYTLGTKSKYIFDFNGILPATSGSFLTAQYSVDGGSNILNTNYLQRKSWASTSDNESSAGGKVSGIALSGIDTDANTAISTTASQGGLNGLFTIYNPASAINKQAKWDIMYRTVLGYLASSDGIATYTGSTTAINYIRFIMKAVNSDTNNGNIASGFIDVYESII